MGCETFCSVTSEMVCLPGGELEATPASDFRYLVELRECLLQNSAASGRGAPQRRTAGVTGLGARLVGAKKVRRGA